MGKIRLYKYCSLATKEKMRHIQSIITDKELYFSDPREFNDPYDCNILHNLEKYHKDVGVLCFSGEDNDDILMFAHYADRHRGLRLEFEIDDECNKTIDEVRDEIGCLGFAKSVVYTETIPKIEGEIDSHEKAHHRLLLKSRRWEYEKEHRVFKPVEKNGSRIMNYMDGQLKGITFGVNMCHDDEAMVRCWTQDAGEAGHISFRKAKLITPDSFSFEIELVDI